MAFSSSSSVQKASYHARSISLPTRLHPLAEQLAEQIASTSSSSSLTHRLNGLNGVYSSLEEFLQLPQNQHPKRVEESLDRSLRLLDICTTSRDVLVKSKEHLHDLQSVLRRRCSGELTIANEADQYLNNRKTVKKIIKKCLQSIKPSVEIDETNDVVDVLSEVEAITVNAFKALLSYLGGAEVKSTRSRWSLVAKLVHQRSQNVEYSSEFDALDETISLISQKKKKNKINLLQIEDLRNQLVTLELDIQELDEILECLFRHLVKTRASLLNILSN